MTRAFNRSCLFDNNVRNILIEKNQEADSPNFGLLIGQRLSNIDYVYYTIASNHHLKYQEYNNNQNLLYKKIESKLIKLSNQISKMLIGGVDIIGLYITSLKITNMNSVATLKMILFTLFKYLDPDLNINKPNYGMLLEISNSNKFHGSYYDLTNKQYSSQNIEVNFSNHLSTFISIQFSITINCTSFENSVKNKQICKNISKENIAFITKHILNEKLLMINEEICVASEEMIESKLNGDNKLNISLLSDMTKPKYGNSYIKEYDSIYSAKGMMHCKSFLNRKCTINDTLKAMMQDAFRSMLSRYKLISLGLETSEENFDNCANNLFELPKRIFSKFGDLPFEFCDYVLREEIEADYLLRFVQLIDAPSIVIPNLETFQDIEIEEEVVEHLTNQHALLQNTSNSNISKNLIYMSLLIAIMGILIIYAIYY